MVEKARGRKEPLSISARLPRTHYPSLHLGNMKVPESILAPASTALSVGAFAAVMGLIKELSVLEKEVQPYTNTKETSEAGPAPPGQC